MGEWIEEDDKEDHMRWQNMGPNLPPAKSYLEWRATHLHGAMMVWPSSKCINPHHKTQNSLEAESYENINT